MNTPRTQPPPPSPVFNNHTGTYTTHYTSTNPRRHRTVQGTPTTTFQPPGPPSQYTIGGVVYKTVTTENVDRNTGVTYNNTWRVNLDDKARIDFVKQVESK